MPATHPFRGVKCIRPTLRTRLFAIVCDRPASAVTRPASSAKGEVTRRYIRPRSRYLHR